MTGERKIIDKARNATQRPTVMDELLEPLVEKITNVADKLKGVMTDENIGPNGGKILHSDVIKQKRN